MYERNGRSPGVRRLTNDANTPPLLPVARTSLLHRPVQLRVRLDDVVLHLVGTLLDLHSLGLLDHDLLVELLVKPGELNEILLDLLDGLVAPLHGAERRLRLAAAVALQQLANKHQQGSQRNGEFGGVHLPLG